MKSLRLTRNGSLINVNIGGIEEDSEWCIDFNYKVSKYTYDKPIDVIYSELACQHCTGLSGSSESTTNGLILNYANWICPRVVIQSNEGGYAATVVCLDCIMEAGEKLNKGEIE